MGDDGATEDPITALHGRLDTLALSFFEATRGLPSEPRTPGAPHPEVARLAADVVRASRAVDAGADAVAAAPAAEADDLAAARARHEAARLEVLAAAAELRGARDALTTVLDGVIRDAEKLGKDAVSDVNVRPRVAALDPALPPPTAEEREASNTLRHWPPGSAGRVKAP